VSSLSIRSLNFDTTTFDTTTPGRPTYPRSAPPSLHESAHPSLAGDISENQLLFTRLETDAIGEIVDLFKSQGRRSAAICTDWAGTDTVQLLIAEFARHNLPAPAIADCSDAAAAAQGRDGLFCAISDPMRLSKSLTRLGHLRGGFVWAPKTSHYFRSRPVFVQSVPKSGTHIVFECLKAFGYAEPPSLDLPDFNASLADGVFYNLQHMPISCLSSPYQRFPQFIQSLSRSVTVFIVRDPRDVVVSLAYYLAAQTDYHITTSLFREMPVSERVGRVLTGEYPIPIYLNRYLNLSGGIRDLLAPYLAWWSDTFPNVWRMRYEDIIGAEGGGDAGRQLQTIWELQLALHVPGRPGNYRDRVFSRDALTFRRGQIGDYLFDFSKDHHGLFERSAGDLLGTLGYGGHWKIARDFAVSLPYAHELSAMVASQLRAELASHGRDFLSITIQASGADEASRLSELVVQARGLSETGSEDRVLLSIDICDSVRGTMAELRRQDGSRYAARMRETSSPQTLVKAIVEALVKIGCVERLSEPNDRRDPNSRFVGEIGAVGPENKSGLPVEQPRPQATIEALNQERSRPQIRTTMGRWLQSRQPGTYSSAQVD